MRHAIKTLLIALPLLTLLGPALANGAGEPAIYEGRVNHVAPGAVLRIAYKGGQIRVKPHNLSGDDIETEELKGRHVRVLDGTWRDGYLEGRLELVDNTWH
ncbi:MAG: hypothetical protein U5S82_02170 [Gammaproteobacteria bacterium]|nr:hypothetical protein [Gammaproteobacteria bacterium]